MTGPCIHTGYIRRVVGFRPMAVREVELTPAAFQVLLALAAGEGHGYAVMKYVEDLSDGSARIPAGTLYRTIARLLANGLVEEAGGGDPTAAHDARRRYYRLTSAGKAGSSGPRRTTGTAGVRVQRRRAP